MDLENSIGKRLEIVTSVYTVVSEEIYSALVPEEESLMMSTWPQYKEEWNFAAEENVVEHMKEVIRGVRNVRAEMNVAPSRKAKAFIVCENETLRDGLEEIRISSAPLMNASEIVIQSDKEGIAEDAVSVVVTDAVVYLPLAELVDFEQEIERLKKEEAKLEKELARVNGMLGNEKFISKAPEAKINEEKAKLEKYTQMMEQVKERLAGLQK